MKYFFIPCIIHFLAKNIMKLKTILCVLCFAGSAAATYAQTSDAEADAVINLLGIQKREAISKLVHVAPNDSASFWKIYDQYEKENKQTAKERLGLYEKTVQAYSNLTPAIADSLANEFFKNRFDQEKSIQAYYKKIKDATDPIVAFEFYQAEVYLLTQIRAQIIQQIPTYGQLVNAAKQK